jgi:hypothetical protein
LRVQLYKLNQKVAEESRVVVRVSGRWAFIFVTIVDEVNACAVLCQE